MYISYTCVMFYIYIRLHIPSSITVCLADDARPLRSFAWPWNRVCFTGELAATRGCNFTLKYVDQTRAQKVIGYIICRLVNAELHILRIAVKPQWRGHGLATRLLARAFAQAAKKGAGSAFLEVRPSNQSAIALYHRQGFRLIGKKPDYYTDTREDSNISDGGNLRCRKRHQAAGGGDIRHHNGQAGMPQRIGNGFLFVFFFTVALKKYGQDMHRGSHTHSQQKRRQNLGGQFYGSTCQRHDTDGGQQGQDNDEQGQ